MPSSPLIGVDSLADYACFSDESCSDNNHRYMVIGGILCRSFDAHRWSQRIAKIKAECPFQESIQFKSVNAAKLPTARRIIDLFFEAQADRRLDFSCIVFDQTKVRHSRFNDGDSEKGFFKFLFQHYNKHRRSYGARATYRCFHGNRHTTYDLREMRKVLNNTATLESGLPVAPFATVDFAEVRRTNLLQMVDLIAGSVGHATNGKGKDSSKPKSQLTEYVRQKAPIASLATPTEGLDWGFSIWHFELS
jgi:hypothetical protein